MRIVETKVYLFKELSEKAKEKAIESNHNINTYHDWWDYNYEDAKNVLLKIKSFDIDKEIDMDFIEYAIDTAKAILKNHGKECSTYQTAKNFLEEREPMQKDLENNDYALTDKIEILEDGFLDELQKDYLLLLKEEYEYRTSESAITESMEINDMEFTEDGTIYQENN